MRKLFLFSFLIFFGAGRVAAQENHVIIAPDTTVLQSPDYYDEEETDEEDGGLSSQVQGDTLLAFRPMPAVEDSVAIWRSKKEFAYMKNLDSMLREIQRQSQENDRPQRVVRFNPPAGGGLFNSMIFQVIVWSIAIFFVGFILYNLFLSNGIFSRSSAKKRVTEEPIELPENIAENDYERLLRQSYLREDFRMAARYLFLKTLQKLTLRELITFSADKTNTDYLYELPVAKRDGFSSLAFYYEYIWYGNMPVSKTDFDRIELKYNHFLNSI